jgi:hypothetical protein
MWSFQKNSNILFKNYRQGKQGRVVILKFIHVAICFLQRWNTVETTFHIPQFKECLLIKWNSMSVISTFTMVTNTFSGYMSSRMLCSQWISTPSCFKGISGNANPVTKSHIPDNFYPQQCNCGNYKTYHTLHCTLNWNWARERMYTILPPPHLPSSDMLSNTHTTTTCVQHRSVMNSHWENMKID